MPLAREDIGEVLVSSGICKHLEPFPLNDKEPKPIWAPPLYGGVYTITG
jgi:hypothetical protein